ncbi:MAG TPA: helix-turn-helix transcriptional regulator [Candidatus Limadaptatus stercoravium]|nr:helix-turn-helix transcriptional regulator [Candidatus Limadaptatus stercoravium]
MLKTCFPERLKQLRRDNGMLQADLAEHFKVSKSAVSGWEVGRNQPNYDILIEMSILFGVSVDYLIGRRNY